ncbi:MAG: GNAT family N-acetyltransferase [bacterium]
MIENITISEAISSDHKELSSFFDHYNSLDISRNRTDCYLSHNHTIVAKEGSKIVGIIQWCVKEDPNSGVVEFEEFYVLEEYRGKGIGSKILDYSIQLVKDYFLKNKLILRNIYLFVSEDNTSARKLYETYGFKNLNSVGTLFSSTSIELFYCLSISN